MRPKLMTRACPHCGGRGKVEFATGDELQLARKNKGLSLRGMGELLGVSHAYVDDLEKGRRSVSSKMAKRWYSALAGRKTK